MRISFAGGADSSTATSCSRPGSRPSPWPPPSSSLADTTACARWSKKVEKLPYRAFSGTDSTAISDLSAASHTRSPTISKPIKPLPKGGTRSPLIDCFTAPCKARLPIHRDIPEYIELVRRGLYGPALKLITEKNPLPFLTGTICAHRCQNKCTRNFYDESIHIRDGKLVAAARGYDADGLHPAHRKTARQEGCHRGGSPTSIAAAYFLARGGMQTTIFEREESSAACRPLNPRFGSRSKRSTRTSPSWSASASRSKCSAPAPSVAELRSWATPTSSWPPALAERASWASPATSAASSPG